MPEMGVHPVEGKQDKTDQQVFEAEKEVCSFIEDEKLKVLLVQGGGGSGKSLFCHVFAKQLLEAEETDWIPVFINLPRSFLLRSFQLIGVKLIGVRNSITGLK